MRNTCCCDKKRYLGEDIKEGHVMCRCGKVQVIQNSKTVASIDKEETESYQSKMADQLIKKGA